MFKNVHSMVYFKKGKNSRKTAYNQDGIEKTDNVMVELLIKQVLTSFRMPSVKFTMNGLLRLPQRNCEVN